MTSFRFRLERVLDWRRTELSLAEARFRRQAAALAALDRQRASLDAASIRAEMFVRDAARVEGLDLAALDGFRRYAAARRIALAAARAKAKAELDTLQSAMLAARQRLRLLERLRERRQDEWREEFDRELDQLAAESHLARLSAAGRLLP